MCKEREVLWGTKFESLLVQGLGEDVGRRLVGVGNGQEKEKKLRCFNDML